MDFFSIIIYIFLSILEKYCHVKNRKYVMCVSCYTDLAVYGRSESIYLNYNFIYIIPYKGISQNIRSSIQNIFLIISSTVVDRFEVVLQQILFIIIKSL